MNPRKYPHFMEKAKHSTYHSNSVLGKLYDMVKKEGFDNRENYKLPFDERILKRYQLDNAVMKVARKVKTQYDIAMRRVMGQLEIRTEFEVWTTFVMTRPRVGTDYKVQEKVGREAAGLKKQFRDLCLKEVEEKNFDRLEFVAAMYKVTWEETRIALYEARQQHVLPNGTVGLRRVTARSMPLISFPWLFPDELGRIALNTKRLPNLAELGIGLPAAKPKPKGGEEVQDLETALDLAGMDYTRTSDGQYIHRGETLHLFRHNDDDDEGFFANEDVAPTETGASEEEQVLDQPPKKDNGPGDFPTLLNLDTALDLLTLDATSATKETTASNGVGLSPETAADLSLLDFLSSDTGTTSDPSPCLTPIKVSPPIQQQQDTDAQLIPSIAGSSSEVSASISNITHGEAASCSNNKPDAESVVSDSNASSWDRITLARSDSPPVVVVHEPVEDGATAATSLRPAAESLVELVDAPMEGRREAVVLDEPVEYISLGAYLGTGWGLGLGVGQARLTAAELWGNNSGQNDGSGAGGGGRHGLGEGRGSGQGQSQSQGQGQSWIQNQTQGQNQNQNLTWDQKWTGLAPIDELPALLKTGETAAADDESDEEMEYEEDVLEVVEETALERAARFGST